MTDSTPQRRRRRRRSSSLHRLARFLGIERGPWRAVILVMAVAIAGVAAFVALGGGAPADGTTPGSAAVTAPASTPALTPATAPTPTDTLPAVPTLTPETTPSAQPEGIVARRIRIARLGIDLRIVEGDGIDAPMNKAAHYPGTGWPGGGTNIYIYAHAQTGMFLALWKARVGDQVELDLVDGTTREYIVTQVKPKVPWNALQYLDPTPTEQLTLQTSTSYTATAPRFIVIAVPAATASMSPVP